MTQSELLNKIQVCDFVLLETALYLDTHPNCRQALDFYHEHRKMREDYVNTYEETYGPLTVFGNRSTEKWNWSTAMWPWQKEEA